NQGLQQTGQLFITESTRLNKIARAAAGEMEGEAAYDCLEGEGTDRLLESIHQTTMKTLVKNRPQTIPVPHFIPALVLGCTFVFDVHTDPANPKLIKTIDNFAEATGGATGPHGAYALPGRVLIPCLSNAKDKGGRTALVEYGNDGNFIATHWLPTKEDARGAAGADFADGYGYDARVLPRKNALLTSSFTGWNNYTMDFGKLTANPEAMKHFGSTMVMWDFHARQPKKVFQVPGAPLEIRWA